MSAALVSYRWELRKLRALKRTYLGLGAAVAVPLIFSIAVSTQSRAPTDVAFGRYIHETGLAIPLVLLLFGASWMYPLIVALVAGDIVASEDHNGTLKTILTRSVDRGPLLAGKALATITYVVCAILLSGTVAVLAGGVVSGFHPITSLSGQRVAAPTGLGLVFASLAVYLIPMLAIASIGLLLSTFTRNSAGAVVGTLMVALLFDLIGILPGTEAIRPYLLSTQFNAWQGLLRTPVDWAPIIRAAWVCALYSIPALLASGMLFVRRDIDGG
ncbi:MAG TPA: ABC transporter permease [Solirubrobacteraceae bacterium]|jgi:ABC-2 type transport system permease protein|nr:ABC transporter permease [Solirubrobacteraceae bacterium]